MEKDKRAQPDRENVPREMKIRRGDIFEAVLDPVIGCEQGGTRPVLMLQNDVGNRFSPTVIAAAMTSRLHKKRLPTHVFISSEFTGLTKDSIILLEQLRTLDRKRLGERLGHLSGKALEQVNEALKISLDLK